MIDKKITNSYNRLRTLKCRNVCFFPPRLSPPPRRPPQPCVTPSPPGGVHVGERLQPLPMSEAFCVRRTGASRQSSSETASADSVPHREGSVASLLLSSLFSLLSASAPRMDAPLLCADTSFRCFRRLSAPPSLSGRSEPPFFLRSAADRARHVPRVGPAAFFLKAPQKKCHPAVFPIRYVACPRSAFRRQAGPGLVATAGVKPPGVHGGNGGCSARKPRFAKGRRARWLSAFSGRPRFFEGRPSMPQQAGRVCVSVSRPAADGEGDRLDTPRRDETL